MRTATVGWASALALALLIGGTGHAQREDPGGEHDVEDLLDLYDDPTADVIALSDWRYDELYEGWSADALLGVPVQGPSGAEIGEVENLLLDPQGSIVGLIAAIGGLGEIGDTHVAIPWSVVQHRTGAVRVPITEETVTEYGLFQDTFYSFLDEEQISAVTEEVRTGPRIWKATQLLDDYVVLESGEPYGYVSDLVFDDSGDLKAVIVNAANAEIGGLLGDYAYPWRRHDHDWRAGGDTYRLPYSLEEIAGLKVFDSEELGVASDLIAEE